MLSFALVSEDTVFDPIAHATSNIEVFELSISQKEGEFASAALEIQNPRSSLVARRIFISENGLLLFDGTITAVPRGSLSETVEIEAIARPSDADDRVQTLVESLKVSPQYDRLFVPEGSDNDPAEVLVGHSKVLAWSRTSHDVQAADILGEGAEHFYVEPLNGTVAVDVSSDVPKSVSITARTEWSQRLRRTHNLHTDVFTLKTMTPDELLKNFPKPGSELSGGFRVVSASIEEDTDVFGNPDRDEVSAIRAVANDELDPAFIAEGDYEDKAEVAALVGVLKVESDHTVKRKEDASLTLQADVQSVLNTDSVDVEEITLRPLAQNSNLPGWRWKTNYKAGDRISRSGKEWEAKRDHYSGSSFFILNWTEIGETSYFSAQTASTFFRSSRGADALSHMRCRLESRARFLSRAVEISFKCEMPDLTKFDENAKITLLDSRLPGSQATGRVVEYSLIWSGGSRSASVKIACAAGTEQSTGMTLNGSSALPEDPVISVSAAVENDSSAQVDSFETSGDIPATQITVNPISPDSKDYELSLSYSSNDTIYLPRQISLDGGLI